MSIAQDEPVTKVTILISLDGDLAPMSCQCLSTVSGFVLSPETYAKFCSFGQTLRLSALPLFQRKRSGRARQLLMRNVAGPRTSGNTREQRLLQVWDDSSLQIVQLISETTLCSRTDPLAGAHSYELSSQRQRRIQTCVLQTTSFHRNENERETQISIPYPRLQHPHCPPRSAHEGHLYHHESVLPKSRYGRVQKTQTVLTPCTTGWRMAVGPQSTLSKTVKS